MFYSIIKSFDVFFLLHIGKKIVSTCLSWQSFHDLLRWLYNLRLSSLVFPSSMSNEAHSSDHRPPLSSGLLHLQAPTGQSKSEWHAFPWKPQEHLPLMITEKKTYGTGLMIWYKIPDFLWMLSKSLYRPHYQVNRIMSYSEKHWFLTGEIS